MGERQTSNHRSNDGTNAKSQKEIKAKVEDWGNFGPYKKRGK